MFKPKCEVRDHWQTPRHVLNVICTRYLERYGAMFDPCPRHPSADGLKVQWPKDRTVYVNPPYSRGNQLIWTKKCLEQYHRGVTILLLLPFDTSTKLFNDSLMPWCDKVHTFNRRIKFEGIETKPGRRASPNFDSALYLLDQDRLTYDSMLISPLKI